LCVNCLRNKLKQHDVEVEIYGIFIPLFQYPRMAAVVSLLRCGNSSRNAFINLEDIDCRFRSFRRKVRIIKRRYYWREELNKMRNRYFVEKRADYESLEGIETMTTTNTINIKERFRIDFRLEVEINVRKSWDLKNFVMYG